MISTPFPATAVLAFTERFVSMNRTSATPSRVRMEGPALTALERIDAPAQLDTMDRTVRYSVCWCVFLSEQVQGSKTIQFEVPLHLIYL